MSRPAVWVLVASFVVLATALPLVAGKGRQGAAAAQARSLVKAVDPSAAADPATTKTIRIPGGFGPRKVTVAKNLESESQGWGLGEQGIRIAEAWAVTRGKGVRVAIFDTGIDSRHPELAGRVKKEKNFTRSANGAADIHGHGTHCAGIVAMAADGQGYVGVAPECELINVKVLDDDGSGQFGWLPAAIRWAVTEGEANVLSMSLGASDGTPVDKFFPELREAIRWAVEQGVIVVVAAGNDGPAPGTVDYPGRYPEVICVAASDINRNIAQFSSRGPEVVVAAPGDNIWSCIPGGRYAEWDGTSMACPHVAGVAALYVASRKAAGKKVDPAEFRRLIEVSSVSRQAKRPSTASGWGLLQAPAYVVNSPIPPRLPERRQSQFVQEDFTPAGWRKIQSVLPGLRSFNLDFEGFGDVPRK